MSRGGVARPERSEGLQTPRSLDRPSTGRHLCLFTVAAVVKKFCQRRSRAFAAVTPSKPRIPGTMWFGITIRFIYVGGRETAERAESIVSGMSTGGSGPSARNQDRGAAGGLHDELPLSVLPCGLRQRRGQHGVGVRAGALPAGSPAKERARTVGTGSVTRTNAMDDSRYNMSTSSWSYSLLSSPGFLLSRISRPY